VWKNVIGTACSNCQFVVDWISAGKAEENDWSSD
jgi:hypothetical protein